LFTKLKIKKTPKKSRKKFFEKGVDIRASLNDSITS